MQTSNHLLLSLDPQDFEALARDMRPMTFKAGHVLYEPEDTVDWIYFPEQGLISLLSVMLSGTAVETAVVGNEGGVGFLEVAGAGVTFSRALVQIDLLVLRVSAEAYNVAFNASPSLRQRVTSHVELLLAESRQGLACKSHHSHEQRLSWWLLECQDRTGGGPNVPLKQEFLAAMLGIQRSTVSQVANALRADGLIDYTRGEIQILDRPKLERRACECYATAAHYRHLIEARPAGAPRPHQGNDGDSQRPGGRPPSTSPTKIQGSA